MKPRKSKDIAAPLLRKGFVEKQGGAHHAMFYLHVSGRKTHIKTYLSRSKGSKEYAVNAMKSIKKQMRFRSDADAELFFDCDMDGEQYVALLQEQGDL